MFIIRLQIFSSKGLTLVAILRLLVSQYLSIFTKDNQLSIIEHILFVENTFLDINIKIVNYKLLIQNFLPLTLSKLLTLIPYPSRSLA